MEPLAVYLAPKGIGPEKGRVVANGIAVYKDPYGSTRYVLYLSGAPIAALQVVSRDKKHAIIANVYTLPAHRRRGYAAKLLDKARQDFAEVRHAHESMLSPEGKAFSASVHDPAVRRDFTTSRRSARFGAGMMVLTDKDKAVIRSFIDRIPFESKHLFTDGDRLDINGLGGRGVAEWKELGGGVGWRVIFRDLGKKSQESVHRYIVKVTPKNWLEGASSRRDPTKKKPERYRLPEHRSSFHRASGATGPIIGWTPASELHLASAKSWRDSAEGLLKHYRGIGRKLTAREREDVATAREFIRRAKLHETRAGSKKLAKTSRRALEAELWKSWPADYKRATSSLQSKTAGRGPGLVPRNAGRAIVVKNKNGQSELLPLSSLSDKEIFHLLHPARRDPAVRRDFPSSRVPASSSRGAQTYPRVYFEKGALGGSTWRPGYYFVVGKTTKPGMNLVDEGRGSRAGESSYAIAKTPRGGALWVLAKNTRPVRQKQS